MDDSEFFRDEDAEHDEEDPFEDDYYAFFNLRKEVSDKFYYYEMIFLGLVVLMRSDD
jgi:hypothetical protein